MDSDVHLKLTDEQLLDDMISLQNPLLSTLLTIFEECFDFPLPDWWIELNREELVHGFLNQSKVVLPLMEGQNIESSMLKLFQINYLWHF